MGPLESTQAEPPLVLGFSGGGDSTALLARLTRSSQRVRAVVVDHGLRVGSAADAARAAARAQALGASPELVTLGWPEGPRPGQAGARRARMAALCAAARAAGATEIHLAHTLDDQGETILLRLAAGSGWRGLAGMAAASPAPLWPEGRGMRLLRPLLGVRRAALRQELRAAGQAWLEDPANAQPRFARVRARARLAGWAGGALDAPRWAELAARIAPLAARLDCEARDCVRIAAHFEADRTAMDMKAFRACAPEARVLALKALVAAAGGAKREPAETPARRLAEALAVGEFQGATLGGAVLRARGGTVWLGRDPGAVLGRNGRPPLADMPLAAGSTAVWDGRVGLTVAEPGWRAAPGPAGQAPLLIHAGGRAIPLAEAQASGLAYAEWLQSERIAHLLWR